MKRFILALAVLLASITGSVSADAHGGGFCCAYGRYETPYYYGYPAYYYAPPTYYYPQPPATVVFEQPAPSPAATYVQPAPQASPNFVDSSGRTCRNFQTSIDGTPVYGVACVQPDGTWVPVAE